MSEIKLTLGRIFEKWIINFSTNWREVVPGDGKLVKKNLEIFDESPPFANQPQLFILSALFWKKQIL